jgi:glycosyltransferase involved in cell wall biosynthesis
VPGLTVTIITLNESAQIDDCLASVSWADEVLVVDSGSTDGTPERARTGGARVIQREWPGYAAQKNFAANEAAHDWILSVDADERVTPALAAEIRTVLASDPGPAGYRVPRALDSNHGLVSRLSAAAVRSAPRPMATACRTRVGARRRPGRPAPPGTAASRLS